MVISKEERDRSDDCKKKRGLDSTDTAKNLRQSIGLAGRISPLGRVYRTSEMKMMREIVIGT